MYAVRLHQFGPPENLVLEEVPTPEPGPGQVRIAVAAAGVHLIDTALREGLQRGPASSPTELPTIPGREVAGEVVALGPSVDGAWLGRRVVAHLGVSPGGYAEQAVTEVERLHTLPDDLGAEQAVAMVGTGRTTMGILRFADLSAADTVLVLAAAGGIGALLVQYARYAGARVIGAAGGPEKVATVRELGADLAVDYRRPDWADTVRAELGERPATYVFEGVGGPALHTALELLAEGGAHLGYGYAATGFDPARSGAPDAEALRKRGVTSQVVLGQPMFDRIGGPGNMRVLEEEALALAASGTLVSLVQRFPLAAAAEAHRALTERATRGKVVLVP